MPRAVKRSAGRRAAGAGGGALALVLVLMAQVSSSGFTDAASPIDRMPIALVFSAGLIGSANRVNTAAGWWRVRRRAA